MANEIPLGINPKKMLPYNVLIADSSNTDRRLISQFLKSADFKILAEASTGDETINKMKTLEGQVDLLCVEYNFSDMKVSNIINEIRPLYPKLMILIITSFAQKEIIEEIVH